MLFRIIAASCCFLLGASSALAEGHEEGPPPPEGPHILLMPPPDTEPPADFEPPADMDEAKAAILDLFFDLMDTNGDGRLSKDELAAWIGHVHFPHHPGDPGDPGDHGDHGNHGDEGNEGETSGISEGDEGLEGLPHPSACGEELTADELGPQEENVGCAGSESVGNLLNRTVCNTDPYKSNAISLPEGRAADCFGIEAIKGRNIVFEIVKEADASVVFDTSMGKEAFETLVLIGEPGGTVYRINLLSADEADASVTLKFIDHPMF